MTDRPAIKPLFWGETSYGTPEVNTVVGVYRLNRAGDGGWRVSVKSEVLFDSDGRTNFATIEAAKAAAQQDYERRIRSCLLDKPEAVETVGEAGEMPGSNGGFTMAVFKASDVPLGTKLYTRPADTDAAQMQEVALARATAREDLFPAMSSRIKAEREQARRKAFEEAAEIADAWTSITTTSTALAIAAALAAYRAEEPTHE